jgi:long-chain acyl-CoA synthetase
VTNLEQLFGSRIPPEAAHSIYTVRQLIDAGRLHRESATTASPANAWGKLLKELPENDPLLTDLLRPQRALTLASFGVLKIWRLLARLLVRFEVTGLENLLSRGPCLICPNHETYIDPFFLASALPYGIFRELFYVGASEYFATPLRRKAAKWMHLAPVDPDANLVRALQASAYGLRHGKILVLFPEGERSIDGEVKKFKKGAAVLSLHLQVPIVPVAFYGVFPLWPRNRGLSWRALLPWSGTKVQICFGPAMHPPVFSSAGNSSARAEDNYEAVTDDLRRIVIDMRKALRGNVEGSR